jgi:hypothetical protein
MTSEAARGTVIRLCRIIDEIKVGALNGNRVIVTIAEAAEEQHQDAMKQAASILLEFTRMGLPPTEITGWARPHLENLGNVLLGGIPPNGLPGGL